MLTGFAIGPWFLAAMAIRLGVPAKLCQGPAVAAPFAIGVLLACALVRCCDGAATLGRDRRVAGVALAGAVAMLCDGVALPWFPGLHGGDRAALMPAAWRPWGVGCCQVPALTVGARGAPTR